MPRSHRGSGSSRRPRAKARTPRETDISHRDRAGGKDRRAGMAREASGSPPTAQAAPTAKAPAVAASAMSGFGEAAVVHESDVSEPPSDAEPLGGPLTEEPHPAERFQIFVIDSGWNSPARKVLPENFAFLSELRCARRRGCGDHSGSRWHGRKRRAAALRVRRARLKVHARAPATLAIKFSLVMHRVVVEYRRRANVRCPHRCLHRNGGSCERARSVPTRHRWRSAGCLGDP
jgi:hypothetical protein